MVKLEMRRAGAPARLRLRTRQGSMSTAVHLATDAVATSARRQGRGVGERASRGWSAALPFVAQDVRVRRLGAAPMVGSGPVASDA
jgi:hypothetical protein